MEAPTTTLTTNASDPSNTISISQNYLPLGITSAVKDAYFNHNGIIWHYHNEFIVGDKDPKISIIGYVNAYIGGTIQAKGSGADYLSVSGWMNTTSGYDNNDYGTTLTNGVYNNGAWLTSVDRLKWSWDQLVLSMMFMELIMLI